VKRYRFRLETVARVRRVREEQARAELLESRRKLDQAQDEMRRRIESYDQRPRRKGAVAPPTVRADRDHDDRLADAVTAAMAAESAAQSLVFRRVDEWVEAARETATLDRLDRRRREEHEAEVLRQEQRELDDLAASRRDAADDDVDRPHQEERS
jgi:flagellar export protein FliJ